MDPALHNKVHGDKINKKAIPGHTKYLKPCHLHYTVKNHIRRIGSEAKS